MKTPQWLERLRQLPESTKKHIVIAFLAISVFVVILPLVLMQGRNNYQAAIDDQGIQELKANISTQFEEYQKNVAEIEKIEPKTEEIVFGENYLPPLKSTLDHNVSFAINASSSQVGSFLVLDVSMLNFGKTSASIDPMAIRVIQDGRETAPLETREWSPDILSLEKKPLGTTLDPAIVVNGILVFPVKGPTFNLSVPGMKTTDGTQTWSYLFQDVTLNPPSMKATEENALSEE